MTNLYRIDGGIGKNIAFTALIPELVERDGQICIETSYPEVFINTPGVVMIYHSAEPKDPRRFYSAFKNVYASDPYVGNMWNGVSHLLESWAIQLGLPEKSTKVRLPKLYVEPSPEDKAKIDEQLANKKYYVIQIAGGQSPYDIKDAENLPQYDKNQMRAGRNMGMMDSLYIDLKKNFADYEMVQLGLPNEPRLKDATTFNTHFVVWFYIISKADFVIGIDSMMAHAAAAYGVPASVFWDMNTPEQFGWKYDGRNDYSTVMPNGVHIDAELSARVNSDLLSIMSNKPQKETEVVKGEVVK